ncbi:MAG TPA: bifunctional phosphoribosylaminoimidazolecarboxamide formyltransferase/IMP cyclohydrolase [Thermomicrobiales bacterium]|nr:bifunctional phosphoribosylaminoimidazolecarboxamide formyltransferase/IMP cyclohydrolase [Thermomicrobiales bacterium]
MRALISVSDKSGIEPFARALHERRMEIVSTGGTARALESVGIPVTPVSEVTHFLEMLDGRVKTLHPNIHAGLLAKLEDPAHRSQLEQAGVEPITVLVVNLYPFERTATSPAASQDGIVESIDIGGPAMVRAAAKNFAHVYVVTSPDDYDAVLEALDTPDTEHLALRKHLAAKAFGHVSTYDSLVAAWLRSDDEPFPEELTLGLRRSIVPKYGENAHQEAAVYASLRPGQPAPGLLDAEQIKGETLSFNNFLDADAAWNAAQLFQEPTVAIVKHTVPCGLAVRQTLVEAYRAAYEGDSVSAFGGIVALNRAVDAATAQQMRKLKLDIIIAPGFADDSLDLLRKKKATRILQMPNRQGARIHELDVRTIAGAMLVQEPDITEESVDDWQVVTKRAPTAEERRDLEFAWRVIPSIRSNAILFAKDRAIVGLGAGQPNRLESVTIAARKAGPKAKGAVMASDAFFPFPDGVEQGIDAGITAVVQPGGSVRDEEVIAAADAAGISMLFTGTRHFRH